eukprot:UN02876
MEAPLINAKLRKTVLNYGCEIFSVGNPWESTFRIENLGLGADDFIKIANGSHPFSEKFASAERPVALMGMSAFQNGNASSMYAALESLGENTNFDQLGRRLERRWFLAYCRRPSWRT